MARRWYGKQSAFLIRTPASVAQELFGVVSLTRRLTTHCLGQFSVRVLAEYHAKPYRDEQRALNASWALIREVELLCEGVAVVAARTIIPLSALHRANLQLLHLGNRSLGAFLHTSKNIKKQAVEIQYAQARWSRRARYATPNGSILVTETFLPEYWQQLCH
jgi:chorismate lyase